MAVAASVSHLNDYTIGSNLTMTFDNPGNVYIQVLFYVEATLIGTFTLGQVTSASISLSGTQKTNAYNVIPNKQSSYDQVAVRSFSDAFYSNQLGSDQTVTGNVFVDPVTSPPTFATYTEDTISKTITVTDSHGVVVTTSDPFVLVGSNSKKMIANYSKVRGKVTLANKMVANNGSTPINYRFYGFQSTDVPNSFLQVSASVNYSSSGDVTVDLDNLANEDTAMAAFDSRNLLSVVLGYGSAPGVTSPITFVAQYTPLALFSMLLTRDDQVSAPVTLSFAGSIWNKYFGSGTSSASGTLNAGTYQYRWKSSLHDWGALDGTATISIATPAVVSKTAHGFNTGDQVWFTTTGALPTGLSVNTVYYVIADDADHFYLATSAVNALAGTKIATSGSQSGVHTVHGDSMWTTITPSVDGSGNISFSSYINGDLGGSGFSTDKSFTIEVRAYDSLVCSTISGTINVGKPVIHMVQGGIAFGAKYDSTQGGTMQLDGIKVATNLTQNARNAGGTSFSVGSGADTSMVSQSVTTNGGKILILASVDGYSTSSGNGGIKVQVDGTTDYQLQNTNNTAVHCISGCAIITGLAAGSHTFDLRLFAQGGGGAAVASFNYPTITIIELPF